jgi:hypothetical protein
MLWNVLVYLRGMIPLDHLFLQTVRGIFAAGLLVSVLPGFSRLSTSLDGLVAMYHFQDFLSTSSITISVAFELHIRGQKKYVNCRKHAGPSIMELTGNPTCPGRCRARLLAMTMLLLAMDRAARRLCLRPCDCRLPGPSSQFSSPMRTFLGRIFKSEPVR